MTDSYICTLVKRLNKGTTRGLIHKRSITSSVDFAKCWIKHPLPTDSITFPDGPYSIYFFKDNSEEYVGAVVDMTQDLHWFVMYRHRGKGHLTKALKTAILPHIFAQRKEQRITISVNQIGPRNFKNSEKVALSIGFKKVSENEYLLKRTSAMKSRLELKNDGITEERLNELKRHVNYLGLRLWLIQTEIEMKTEDVKYGNELSDLVEKLRSHTWKLGDAWWRAKKS
jgi:hypothetical protein